MNYIILIIFFIVIFAGLCVMTWAGYRGFALIMDTLRSVAHRDEADEDPACFSTEASQEPEDSADHDESDDEETNTTDQDTAAMAFDLLESEGCMPRYNEDKGIICKFQGETFILIPNMKFIRIFDPNWATTKVTDDDFNVVIDAINRTNHNFGPVVLMSPPHPETGQIAISSRYDIYFSDAIPNLKTYFFTMLGSFFETQKKMREVFDDLRSNPDQCMIYENPIGFDTASLSNPDSPRAN